MIVTGKSWSPQRRMMRVSLIRSQMPRGSAGHALSCPEARVEGWCLPGAILQREGLSSRRRQAANAVRHQCHLADSSLTPIVDRCPMGWRCPPRLRSQLVCPGVD